MRLFIRPLDTQFYRDGRPFDAGVESAGRSNFVPYPRTLYGALRACMLSYHSNWQAWPSSLQVRSVIGSNPAQFGSLTICGPVMAKDLSGNLTNICPLYPIPKDLVKVKYGREYLLLKPLLNKSTLKEVTNFPWSGIYLTQPTPVKHVEDVEERERHFLSHDYLIQYLRGEAPKTLEEAKKVFQFEPRIGIGLNYSTRTVELGLLYSANHVRMDENVGIVVDVENHNDLLPEKGLLRLGGDSRPVEYNKVDDTKWADIIEEVKGLIKQEGKFKIHLITPAIFEKGWYPDFLSDKNGYLMGNLPNTAISIKLVGACVGRSIPIGGFDIKKGHPKPIRKAAPPGSVYFFQFTDWNSWSEQERKAGVNLLFKEFFYKSLADRAQSQAPWKEGFGLALIGRW